MNSKYPVFIITAESGLRRDLVYTLRQERVRATPFASGTDFLKALDFIEPGVALLDLQLPDMTGMAVLDKIRSGRRDVGVIMISAKANIRIAVQAMKHGADDFLEQPLLHDLLLATIKEAAFALTTRISSEARRRTATSCTERLSKRELEVFRWLEVEHDNQKVADKLHMSVRTVEKYRSTIMKKCGTKSFLEALLLCGTTMTDETGDCGEPSRGGSRSIPSHPS